MEKKKEWQKKHYASHPELAEKRRKACREWRLRNLEKVRIREREHYRLNPKKKNQSHSKWRVKNREKLRIYQKTWRDRNREFITRQRVELKKKLIELKGGKCEICGWSGHQVAFDFHHLNPNEKEWKNKGGEWVLKKYREEVSLKELQLLCANCHRILHWGIEKN